MPETMNTYGRYGHFTNNTYQGTQIEDTHNRPHHSDHQIQHIHNMAFTIVGHPSQLAGFTALLHLSTQIMSSITTT